jgi:hypothetical protein
MYDQIYQYLTDNSLLSEHQFGFRKYHSMVCQYGPQNVKFGCFVDLKKAFDTIDHRILLRKLELYGIKGSVLAMIRSYVSDRNKKMSCL